MKDKEIKGTPNKIYLQINDEDERPEEVNFFDLTGISWCSDQLNDSDIEYTLSTLANQQLAEKDKEIQSLKENMKVKSFKMLGCYVYVLTKRAMK